MRIHDLPDAGHVLTPAGIRPARVTLRGLVGSGDRIGLLTLPVLVVGLVLNVAYPSLFAVGGPSAALRAVSIAVLVPGGIIWAWSVVLILRKVPRGELITSGPYALVKHPLYTGVALLVLPWIGFLFNTWLGAVLGAAVYVGSRLFSPHEEAELARAFGPSWNDYRRSVKIPWL
jgi:protein-S-isoprenylcysteine O-methyltransferase Ste14